MDLVWLCLNSFVTGFSGALVPGPLFVTTVLYSTKKGSLAGPLLVFGHAFVELLITLFILLGLGLVLSSNVVRIVVGLFGGLALVWMGVETFKFAKGATLQKTENMESFVKMLKYGPILGGMLSSISNPYFFLWWATVGNVFIFQGLVTASIFGVLIFYLSHIASDFTWYTLVSTSIHKGRKFVSDKSYKIILYVCSVFLIILAVSFIYESLLIFAS